MSGIKILVVLLLIGLSSQAQFMNVRNWKKTERDSLEKGLQLLEEKKTQQALPIFENILNNHPTEDFLKYSYAKCALNQPDKQTEAYKRLNEVYEKNRKTPDIQYYMAMAAYYNYSYDEAFGHITNYLANRKVQAEARKNAEALKRLINNARYFYTHPTRSKVFNIGANFNSPYDESLPAITADESILLYNYSGTKSAARTADSGAYTEQVYLALKEEGEFKNPVKSNSLLPASGDMALSLSNDGSSLFLLRKELNDGGDLYRRDLNGSTFGPAYKLKGAVNSSNTETYCSLSPNGQTLYFSSDRPGGYGGKDLYRASLSADSTWVNVVNLGDSVNTPLDEEAPFIHADGKTLFFSSKGHANMGGYDVFKTQMNSRDSSFKKIDNLGSPVNTPADDIYFVVSANAENAYLSSNRKDGLGNNDIYHVEPNIKSFKPSLCLLKGSVSRNEKPCGAQIKVEQISGKKNFSSLIQANTSTGNYLVVLPTGGEYKLTYSIKNYKSKTAVIDLSDMVGFVEKIKNMSFDAILDSLKPSEKPAPVEPDLQITSVLKPKKENPAAAQLPVALKTNTLVPNNQVPATIKRPEVETPTVAANTTLETKPTEPATTHTSSGFPEVKTNELLKKDSLLTKPTAVSPVKHSGDTLTVKSGNTSTTLTVKTVSPEPVAQNPDAKEAPKTSSTNPGTALLIPAKTETLLTPTVTNTNAAKPSPQVAANHAAFNIDGFEPNSATQEKMMMNAYKYGHISYDSLEFRVQISAFKNNERYYFPRLEKFGKIEKVELGDGYKRLMLGGHFSTYGRAFAYSKKIIKAGHQDVFIVVVYKGYRYSVEDLEAVGIFK